MPGRFERILLVCVCLVLAVTSFPLSGAQRGSTKKSSTIKTITVQEKDGQILSYRHNTGSIEVRMRGTRLAPDARIKLKVESRPGFLEIDINRRSISGLKPAIQYGRDFLTYVMWAVSIDGKALNLGEITFKGDRPISINVTTPYQTFWLLVTAEPDYAVAEPSSKIILYSVGSEKRSKKDKRKALPIGGDLFFYTHYTDYDSTPGVLGSAPNELLQARKAVELASQSGILAAKPSDGVPVAGAEERTRTTLNQARTFLDQAESTYKRKPKSSDTVQFARTAAQIAENARALALGAVGGVVIRQLESELAKLQTEVSRVRTALSKARSEELPVVPKVEEPPVEPVEEPPTESIITQPAVWFGLIGWGLALLLLLRRKTN